MTEGLSPWDSLTIATKVAAYAGMVAVLGASWIRWLQKDMPPAPAERLLAPYQVAGAALGIIAVLLFFILQVGAINQQGWRGMFDPVLAPVLGASSIGQGAQLRAAGFLCALIAAVSLLLGSAEARVYRVVRRLALPLIVAAALFVCVSFAVLGHVATLSLLARTAIALHVLAISLWAGSLYPLFRLSGIPGPAAAPVLRRFGELAWGIVALLLLTGLFLLTRLLETPAQLISSDYGRILLAKLLLVAVLLGLGALNKLRLVPQLARGESAQPLRRVVAVEMLLVLAIFVLTAWLTTLTGPPAGM